MKTVLLALSAAGMVAAGFPSAASAANYTLWIHGRTGSPPAAGNYAAWSYWGSSATAKGVNPKSVNWDGYSRISSQNYRIRDALDCFCTGANWCYVAAHSAGNAQIGYALSLYGGSTRYKKNAVPNASGVCGNSDGTTQVGWNVKWIDVGGGAAGGSELADLGYWATSEPLVQDLKTSTMRALYNHATTRGVWLYMFAGAKGTLYSGILPGQDDEAVAYHSSGGVSGSSGGSYCNPSDWFCNDLTTGSGACEGGRAKWSYHSVDFRDDGESHNHYTNGSWGGIVSVVRSDVVTYAK